MLHADLGPWGGPESLGNGLPGDLGPWGGPEAGGLQGAGVTPMELNSPGSGEPDELGTAVEPS